MIPSELHPSVRVDLAPGEVTGRVRAVCLTARSLRVLQWVQSVSAPARRYVPAGVPPAAAQWAGLAATAAGAGLALWLLFKVMASNIQYRNADTNLHVATFLLHIGFPYCPMPS